VINSKLQSIRVAEWRRRFKKSAVDMMGGRCAKCGYNSCLDALDFHHRDSSEKEFAIGKYRKLEDALIELKKCDLLCANCHRETHAEMRQEVIRTQTEYAKINGRSQRVEVSCSKCTASKTVWASRWKPGKKFFCSVDCMRKFFARPFTPEPEKVKRAVYPSPEKLRTLVWEKPVLQLASDFGVSSSAVKKWCKKRGIATPPPGYWMNKTPASG
jgi:hypothetical protein